LFGFELALFFRHPKEHFIYIIISPIDTYIHFSLSQIGFVFSN